MSILHVYKLLPVIKLYLPVYWKVILALLLVVEYMFFVISPMLPEDDVHAFEGSKVVLADVKSTDSALAAPKRWAMPTTKGKSLNIAERMGQKCLKG